MTGKSQPNNAENTIWWHLNISGIFQNVLMQGTAPAKHTESTTFTLPIERQGKYVRDVYHGDVLGSGCKALHFLIFGTM